MVAFPCGKAKSIKIIFFLPGQAYHTLLPPARSSRFAVLRSLAGSLWARYLPAIKKKKNAAGGSERAASEGEATMKKDIKEELVKLITEKIATDKRLPWDKGLLNGEFFPINSKTGKRYRGINLLLLMFLGGGTQEYMTFNQAQEAGGHVKKGAKALPIVYWNVWNKKEHRPAEPGDDEEDTYGFLKKFSVFEVGGQVEGVKPRREFKTRENPHNIKVEDFIRAFAKATHLQVNQVSRHGIAFYRPGEHAVYTAPVEEYKTTESWAATILHECVHSTADAMGRELGAGFGSVKYSKEEVVAEFGAALLCREFGITEQEDNTAAYLQSWSQKLKENPDWLINGANAAQKAVDYMFEMAGYIPQGEEMEEAGGE